VTATARVNRVSAPSFDPSFHSSWPASARELILRAIERHGGWERWTRLESVTLSLVSLEGFLPWLEGYGRTFHLARSLTTYPKLGRTDWSDGAVFDRGAVRLPGGPASPNHRRTFRGLRKLRRWGELDGFYFFGYAFASYTAVPFILPTLPFRGAVTGRWRGERLRGVRVEHPAGAEVHSRRQSYLFDETGLLRRNDYVADVVGRWAVGTHGWDDFATIDGLAVPARRTVMPHWFGITCPFPTVLSATFDGIGARFTAPR
jgi:hypothetical protein